MLVLHMFFFSGFSHKTVYIQLKWLLKGGAPYDLTVNSSISGHHRRLILVYFCYQKFVVNSRGSKGIKGIKAVVVVETVVRWCFFYNCTINVIPFFLFFI